MDFFPNSLYFVASTNLIYQVWWTQAWTREGCFSVSPGSWSKYMHVSGELCLTWDFSINATSQQFINENKQEETNWVFPHLTLIVEIVICQMQFLFSEKEAPQRVSSSTQGCASLWIPYRCVYCKLYCHCFQQHAAPYHWLLNNIFVFLSNLLICSYTFIHTCTYLSLPFPPPPHTHTHITRTLASLGN